MFEIGFPELVLIAIVGLLVIGPERLPEALRTLGLWFGRMRRSFTAVKAEIEKEIGMDEVRRQLHNEAIMEEMKRIESEVKSTANAARTSLNRGVQSDDPTTAPVIDPNTQGSVSDLLAAQGGEPPPVAPPTDKSMDAADDRDHSDAGREADAEGETAELDDRDHSDAADTPPPVRDAAKGS
jgi:sec-independent protein translocase protein TatB